MTLFESRKRVLKTCWKIEFTKPISQFNKDRANTEPEKLTNPMFVASSVVKLDIY